MNKEELKDRTKKLALDVIRFSSRLPQKQDFWVISKQLIRSATSVGANYRSACRAKSKADFIAKLADFSMRRLQDWHRIGCMRCGEGEIKA